MKTSTKKTENKVVTNEVITTKKATVIETVTNEIIKLTKIDLCLIKLENKDNKQLCKAINVVLNEIRISDLKSKSIELDDKKAKFLKKDLSEKQVYRNKLKGEFNSIFQILKVIKEVDKSEGTKKFKSLYSKTFHVAMINVFLTENQFLQVLKNNRQFSLSIALNSIEKIESVYDTKESILIDSLLTKGEEINALITSVVKNECTIETAFNQFLELKK
jgi:hypothetical protein